jgi:predicted enzyme related to lactoylglutathione lyase
MSTQTKPTSRSIVWFEIPADDVERAKSFYGELFGWKIERFPGPMEYWHIDTGGSDDTPDGGLLKRQNPGQQGITNYIGVASVDESAVKVEKPACCSRAKGCTQARRARGLSSPTGNGL